MSEPTGYPQHPQDYIIQSTTGRFVTIPLATVADSGTELVAVDTNNLPADTAVYVDASGNFHAASADDPVKSDFVGFVVEDGVLRIGGVYETSGLTPGATYFLGLSGAISTDYPTTDGHAIVRVGYAISASMLVIDHQEIVIL